MRYELSLPTALSHKCLFLSKLVPKVNCGRPFTDPKEIQLILFSHWYVYVSKCDPRYRSQTIFMVPLPIPSYISQFI